MDSKPRLLRVSFPEWKRPMRRWTLTNDHPVGESRRYVCCDCGLVHAAFYHVDTKKHKRVVIKTSYRDDYETDKERRNNAKE